MYKGNFIKGMGIGIAAGAIAGMVMTADKKKLGCKTSELFRMIGDIASGVIKAIE
ncbi:MAG: hypothetical protein GX847_06775 [Clostridiales bacterium]|nr:hypothetical protein [Clostridiales bacterium]